MQKKGFFVRLMDLWRGFWGAQLEQAEASNADAVYSNAIRQRQDQHHQLKEAVSRLIYLRNRIESDLGRRQEDLEVIGQALSQAVEDGDDDRALGLIRRQRLLEEELERLQSERDQLRSQVLSSKEGLAEINKAVRHLKEERAQMLARKTHAEARLQVNSALQASRGDFSAIDSALENVRESIARLEHSAELDAPAPGTDDISMPALRQQATEARDRATLARLRRGTAQLPDGGQSGVTVAVAEGVLS